MFAKSPDIWLPGFSIVSSHIELCIGEPANIVNNTCDSRTSFGWYTFMYHSCKLLLRNIFHREPKKLQLVTFNKHLYSFLCINRSKMSDTLFGRWIFLMKHQQNKHFSYWCLMRSSIHLEPIPKICRHVKCWNLLSETTYSHRLFSFSRSLALQDVAKADLKI